MGLTADLSSLNQWEEMVSPKTFQKTNYFVTNNVLHIHSQSAHSGLVWTPTFNILETPNLSFSWKISHIFPSANITQSDLDDAPIRILILFTEDTQRKSWVRQQLDKLFLMVYKKLPNDYAMAYVWSNHPQKTPIEGAYTYKLRTIPLNQGAHQINTWQHHKRDLLTDFHNVFDFKPPTTARIGILSDTDNTHSEGTAWVKNIHIF